MCVLRDPEYRKAPEATAIRQPAARRPLSTAHPSAQGGGGQWRDLWSGITVGAELP